MDGKFNSVFIESGFVLSFNYEICVTSRHIISYILPVKKSFAV